MLPLKVFVFIIQKWIKVITDSLESKVSMVVFLWLLLSLLSLPQPEGLWLTVPDVSIHSDLILFLLGEWNWESQ